MSLPTPPNINQGQIALDPVNGVVYYKDNDGNLVATTWSWLRDGLSEVSTDDNVTITGDLTVEGETVTMNATQLLVEDNVVTLNSNVTGAPVLDAGIEIERGTSSNVFIRWNETTDKWEFTNNGSTYIELGSVAENSVQLGFHTTGNYVEDITAGTGITVSGGTGEGSNNIVVLNATIDQLNDVATSSATPGQILQYDGTNWINTVAPSSEPIGHENKDNSTISFNESTREFSISPVGDSHVVWCVGKKFTKTTTETVTIPDTTGLYYIYYNSSGVLSYKTTFFTWDQDTPTSYIYWNADDNKAYFFADERHGVTLDWATHEYLHRTRGAAIANGFGANNYDLTGDANGGNSDIYAKLDIADGTFFDEDLQVDITHSASPAANTWQQILQGNAEIPVFYKSGTAWIKDSATEFPIKQGSARAQYNLDTAGVWSTVDIASDRFGISWIIATNNLNEPVIAVLGQGDYPANGAAHAAFYESLNLDGFPIVEFRPLYKIVYKVSDTYTNSVKTVFTDITDLRSIISGGFGVPTVPVNDHGNMTGLSDDDHTQYLTSARHDILDHSVALGTAVLDDLSDVNTSGATSNYFLKNNGSSWVASTLDEVIALNNLSDVNTSGATANYYLKNNGTSWVASEITETLNLNDLKDVNTSGVALDNTLKWDGSSWVPTATVVSLTLDDLTDVNTSGATANYFLKNNGTSWVASQIDEILPLNSLSDVNTSGVVTDNVLKYNGSSWVAGVASTVAALDDLTDVVITSATPNNILKYDGSNWINATPDQVNAVNTTSITTNSATTIDSFSAAASRTAEYLIQVTQGSKYTSSKVVVNHNGTTAYMTEFAVVEIGTPRIPLTISATISGGNVLLQATITDAASTNATVKLLSSKIEV